MLPLFRDSSNHPQVLSGNHNHSIQAPDQIVLRPTPLCLRWITAGSCHTALVDLQMRHNCDTVLLPQCLNAACEGLSMAAHPVHPIAISGRDRPVLSSAAEPAKFNNPPEDAESTSPLTINLSRIPQTDLWHCETFSAVPGRPDGDTVSHPAVPGNPPVPAGQFDPGGFAEGSEEVTRHRRFYDGSLQLPSIEYPSSRLRINSLAGGWNVR